MLKLIFILLFSIWSIFHIFVESTETRVFKIKSSFILHLNRYSTVIKAIPTGLLSSFVFIMKPDDSPFYNLLLFGFLFCMMGDIAIEKEFVHGLLLFFCAQILLSSVFIYQSVKLGILFYTLIIPFLVVIVIIGYIFLLLRYLESPESGLGKFKVLGILYFLVLNIMFSSTILLWITTSEVIEVWIVVLGGLLFISSDLIIAIHHFNHNIKYKEIKVMITYYCAIFFLSFAVFIM